jgi:hypothetical protein
MQIPIETAPESGSIFLEFRRKIQAAEVLSASLERLLGALHFSGRVTVVVQNGRVLKSGYEEGYFTRRKDVRML